MVHALLEAHRVLKPGGILVDLRPAAVHRRVGLGEGRRWQFIGALHEVFDDDYAADAAIDHVIWDGIFRLEKRTQFQLDRVLDTMQDFREWLADFDQRRELPSHARLLDRLEGRLDRLRKPVRIVVRGPMKLGVLKKVDRPARQNRTGESMILAILPDPSKVESLLNNLSEAEFNLDDVSVIMSDETMRDKVSKDAGPLRGAKPAQLAGTLKQLKIAKGVMQACSEAVAHGKVLVAMSVDQKYEPAALEMFKDVSAQILQE